MKTLPAFALALLLTACGQTGPLRQPEPKPAPAPAAAGETKADEPKTPPTP